MSHKAPKPPPKNQRRPSPPPAPPMKSRSVSAHELRVAARALAIRTKKYVSVDGKPPVDKFLECDIEMWNLAQAVLRALGETC